MQAGTWSNGSDKVLNVQTRCDYHRCSRSSKQLLVYGAVQLLQHDMLNTPPSSPSIPPPPPCPSPSLFLTCVNSSLQKISTFCLNSFATSLSSTLLLALLAPLLPLPPLPAPPLPLWRGASAEMVAREEVGRPKYEEERSDELSSSWSTTSAADWI